jgi:hypothetical protein
MPKKRKPGLKPSPHSSRNPSPATSKGRPVPASRSSPKETQAGDRPAVKWVKWIIAAAGAIVAVGGAVAVISQTTHILGNFLRTPTQSSPTFSVLSQSPILGVSFYQNGNIDPMAPPPNGAETGPISVAMQPEPFELRFPDLGASSALEVCASDDQNVFSSAARTGQSGVQTCLSPTSGAADYPYGSGALVVSSPSYIAHTEIAGSRAIAAPLDHQQFYVSRLASFPHFTPTLGPHQVVFLPLTREHGRLYLVIYQTSNGSSVFESGK